MEDEIRTFVFSGLHVDPHFSHKKYLIRKVDRGSVSCHLCFAHPISQTSNVVKEEVSVRNGKYLASVCSLENQHVLSMAGSYK